MNFKFNNLYDISVYQAKKKKRKTALFADEKRVTYAEILQKVDKLAEYLLAKGIKEGDKVALFLRNSPEFIYAIFAISKIGAISVPINTFLKEKEVDYILEDSGAKLLLASEIYENVIKKITVCQNIIWEGVNEPSSLYRFEDAYVLDVKSEHKKRAHDDCAVIIYTSGTTGNPKGAMLSNKNLLSNMEYASLLMEVTAKDTVMVFLPMFHSFTLTAGVLMSLYCGGSIVIIKSIQPFANIIKQTLTKRVTLFFGIPDVYNSLAKAKLPWYFLWFNKIRAFVSGAAALQPKTIEAMAKKFKRAKLLEGYGLSEASPVVCVNTIKKQKVGSVGCVMYGNELKIVNEELEEVETKVVGDIIYKGDNVMLGYLNRPEATKETIINGWLQTGDMGYVDEEGFLFIVDRKKDLIISKGINIYPRGIEEVIDAFPGVLASAVIGIFDERSGEVPIAYIELEEGVSTLDTKGLRQHMRKNLANFKIPKQLNIIEKLPKNATGKVLKRALKEKLRNEEK
ncbi:O-succinylbenzoic acid--CoA ligase [hydrothermal vent metagenome]|uniref:Long-chain-fatty-acid--CoA ligase n=1 Tax=hydrothermal vent metagenome TaxID=652676 RepID=A0A1W1EBX2_9ZZZZ